MSKWESGRRFGECVLTNQYLTEVARNEKAEGAGDLKPTSLHILYSTHEPHNTHVAPRMTGVSRKGTKTRRIRRRNTYHGWAWRRTALPLRTLQQASIGLTTADHSVL